jgi:hypothetical protein
VGFGLFLPVRVRGERGYASCYTIHLKNIFYNITITTTKKNETKRLLGRPCGAIIAPDDFLEAYPSTLFCQNIINNKI